MTNTPINLREQCDLLRSQWKQFSMSIKQLIGAAKAQKVAYSDSCNDTGEVIANMILAYRHSEDSVMRLGKCIQADAGWESIYDSKDTKETPKDMSTMWLVLECRKCQSSICIHPDNYWVMMDLDCPECGEESYRNWIVSWQSPNIQDIDKLIEKSKSE